MLASTPTGRKEGVGAGVPTADLSDGLASISSLPRYKAKERLYSILTSLICSLNVNAFSFVGAMQAEEGLKKKKKSKQSRMAPAGKPPFIVYISLHDKIGQARITLLRRTVCGCTNQSVQLAPPNAAEGHVKPERPGPRSGSGHAVGSMTRVGADLIAHRGPPRTNSPYLGHGKSWMRRRWRGGCTASIRSGPWWAALQPVLPSSGALQPL